MLNASLPFLFPEVVQDAPLGVFIYIDAVFVHIVQQVEVEVFHTAFFQLRLENRCRIINLSILVTRVFIGQKKAFPRVFRQHTAHNPL